MSYKLSKLLSLTAFIALVFTNVSPAIYAQQTNVGLPLFSAPTTMDVTPLTPQIQKGTTQQFVATVNLEDGSQIDVTNDPETVWSSQNTYVSSVNATGLATAIRTGNAYIRASFRGVSDQALLTVTAPPTVIGGGGGGGGGTGGGSTPPSTPTPTPEPEPEPEPTPTPTPEPEPEPAPTPQPEPTPTPTPEPTPTPTPIPSPTPEPEPAPVVVAPPGPVQETRTIPSPPPAIVTDEDIPDELSVSRGEILQLISEEFDLSETYSEIIDKCNNDLEACMSIFLAVTNYNDVQLAETGGFAESQFYPDVPADNEFSYAINLGTILGNVQGYYEEPQSPFKPDQIISRMEALKVLLGSVELIEWKYYDEIEAELGGLEAVIAQTTPFSDIEISRAAAWWYPRYLNLSCIIDMVDCEEGSEFRPDAVITEAELQDMIDRLNFYLSDESHFEALNADNDGDNLKNYMESTVYFTNPQDEDTDDDNLSDGDEVKIYGTNPFLKDSDADRLSDYDEVVTYNTNPFVPDTDDDNYSDYIEVINETDPLDPESYPVDDDKDGVADDWEAEFEIDVETGITDTDGDGVSDKLEYQYGTNPKNADTDGDGLTDSDEINLYGTDPLVVNSIEDLGVKITNFTQGQYVSDTTPIIKGVAPAGSKVAIYLRNEAGQEIVLGNVITDENDIFIYQTETAIRDGEYILVAKALLTEQSKVESSNPVRIIIDSTLLVDKPVPKELSGEEIPSDVEFDALTLVIDDDKPYLVGETEFGSKVTATWRSIVTSSVLIADAITGEFEIVAPKRLAVGEHEVFVTATRKKDGAQSDTIRIPFEITEQGEIEIIPDLDLKGAADEADESRSGGIFGGLAGGDEGAPIFLYFLIGVGVVVAGAVIYIGFFTGGTKEK